MKTSSYGQYLVRLTRLIIMNSYLVREDDGLTVVDTGMQGSAKGILAAAASLGAPIRRIVLTHAHSDHVGSLDALHALVPDAAVMLSARDARFLSGDLSLDPNEQHDKLAGGFITCATRPDQLLNAGDRVGSLEVIASPGHTPGHIAFLDHRDGTLIAGDAYTTQGGIATAGTFRLAFPIPAMATWSRAIGLESAEKLVALQPARLAVGHGRVLENPVPAMQRAVDDARRKLERTAYAHPANG